MLTVLAEHEEKARAILPAEVFDYYAAGSGEELTRDESTSAWSRFRLRPWPLKDVGEVDTRTRLFDSQFATPVAVAPSAFHGLAHRDGELASIAGATDAGSLFVVSTRASRPFADIAAAATGPWWFQVYAMQDRDLTARVATDAASAGAAALVLTGDTPYVGRKRRVQGVRIALPDDHYLVNVSRHLQPGSDGRAAVAQDPTVGLDAIETLKRLTGLPVLVKGVLRGDAAVQCIEAGADGIIVSNHGGRQLDRAIPSALALSEVVDAVAGQAPVLVDGGIRSGLDVLIALALGARAVFVGRPVLWALAAAGRSGVHDALVAVTEDLRHSMALTGVRELGGIERDLVIPM